MELIEARMLARSLMDEYGLHDWAFMFDQAKHRIGRTRQRGTSVKLISLSEPLTLVNDRSLIEDTIRHEIAHALVGPEQKHNIVWQRMAVKVGAKPYAAKQAVSAPAPYKLVCPNGHEADRYRRPTKEISCSRCDPRFNRKYLFKLVQNGR